MKLLSFDENNVQFGWDSTSLKLSEECLYKYKLRLLEGWQPARKSVHLLFGGWYASALESFHKYKTDGLSHDEALVEVISEALIETWEYPTCDTCQGKGLENWGEPFDQTTAAVCPDCGGNGQATSGGHPWLSDHNTKTRENLIRTIIWYTEEFKDDSCKTVILSDGKAAVEHSFRLPVDDGIVLSGHLDRLVEYAGHLYVQDQKTSGNTITSRYFEQWNPETQMSLYTFAGRAIFHLPVKGVMIDAVQLAVGFSRFSRGFTFRDQSQLDEWYDHAMYHIGIARKATQENYFPMNLSSCGNYGGCEFRNVCSKSPAVRHAFLEGDFVRGERWDPLRSR